MKQDLQKFLHELYQIDSTLREHEAELIVLIEKMLAAKPQIAIDQKFVQNLRRKLLQKEIKTHSFLTSFFSMQRRSLATVGFGAMGVAAIALVLVLQSSDMNFSLQDNKQVKFTVLGTQAFGSLALNVPAGQLGSREAISYRGGGLGSGGDTAVGQTSEPAVGNNPVDLKMIAPMQTYTFRYTGGEWSLPTSPQAVYRLAKERGLGDLGSIIPNLRLDNFNLKNFQNGEVRNITVYQKGPDAYSINIQPFDGRIGIDAVYESWYPNDCGYYSCALGTPLTMNDVPSEEEVVRIASEFLDQYDVQKNNYGTPIVDTRWRDARFMTMTGEEQTYVPDIITVIYPFVVDGHQVFEGQGEPNGLRVNVDIRKKKVQSIWNLTNELYEKSDYEIEQDQERILRIASKGGLTGGWYSGGDTELDLGAPELIYTVHTQYTGGGTNKELFIPAMRFGIVNPPVDQPYTPRFVVVPLIKDILDEYEKQMGEVRPIDGPSLFR